MKCLVLELINIHQFSLFCKMSEIHRQYVHLNESLLAFRKFGIQYSLVLYGMKWVETVNAFI